MQGSQQQPQGKRLLPRAGEGHSHWQGSSQGFPKPPHFGQRPGISMLCSCSMLLRELLTTCRSHHMEASVWRHRLLIQSTSFARFEIIWVQSKSLTCKATIPGQLLVQTSPSGSSQAPLAPGHISCLSMSVFHVFIRHGNANPKSLLQHQGWSRSIIRANYKGQKRKSKQN